MKHLLLILICHVCFAQFKNDFVVADSGMRANMDIENNGTIHLAWVNYKQLDRSVMYMALDTIGNIVYPSQRISKSSYNSDPQVRIRNSTVACIWEDDVSGNFNIFSTYIKGRLIKNGIPIDNDLQIDDGDTKHPPIDAFRRYPKMVWHNDSILYVTWSGQGHHSKYVNQSDVYAEKLFVPLNKSGDNYPLNNTLLRSNIKELTPLKIKSSGYLVIFLEQDSSNINRFSGILCNDSLKPIGEKYSLSELGIGAYIYRPVAIKKPNGNIVLVWEKDTLNNNANIYIQEFTEEGANVNPPQKINETLAKASSIVSADIDSRNNIIVVWENGDQNIAGQRFSQDWEKLGSNIVINKDLSGEDVFPTVRLYDNKIFSVWTKYVFGIPSVWMNILDFNNPVLTISVDTKNPVLFALSQNYPNPFNPTTIINYQLSNDSFVTLKVYDVLGKEVAKLVNGKKHSGRYSVAFNASHLSSGTYIVRMQLGEFVKTMKIVLMK